MGRDAGSSSRRELVDSSRKLLFANISILEKQKESEVFRGDLLAETERVRDARMNFDLDTERYQSFKREQKSQRIMVSDQLKQIRQEKESCEDEIENLNQQIINTQDATAALERQQISPLKLHRKFLNEVSDAFTKIYNKPSTILETKQSSTFITESNLTL